MRARVQSVTLKMLITTKLDKAKLFLTSSHSKAMVRFNFYAVANGRERGVFRSWPECEARVKGYANAVFKAFTTEAAARDFVLNGRVPSSLPPQHAVRQPAAFHAKRSRTPTPPRRSSPLKRKKTPPLRRYDNTGPVIEIYVDGACTANGQVGARGGFGGYYGDRDGRNFSAPLAHDERQSNNRGELRAIEYALAQELESAEQSGVFLPLHIHTDSKYCLDGIYLYMPAWKRNGFITTDRQPVKHQDLWKSIDGLTNDYCRRKEEVDGVPSPQPAVQFSHVKGHSDNRGNAMADMLAVQGAAMQRPRHAESATTEPPRSRGRRLEPPLQPEDVFSCSLCNILTKTTLLLPCRHVVCRSCADTIPKPRRGQDEICPCCGATVDRYVDVV